MSSETVDHRPSRLFIILAGFFVTNAIIAEFIGAKIFQLEDSLGISRFSFDLLGQENLSFQLTAGVLLWPIIFVMTDMINEYYGRKGVRFLSFLTVGLILYAFLMVFIAMHVTPSEWWVSSKQESGIADLDQAFRAVFGQGLNIIVASITAFLIGQLVDVAVFQRIKRATGEKKIWMRTTISTLVSQLIDSYVVLFIAFYFLGNWPLKLVIAIGIMNYIYKFLMAVLLTPLIYLIHGWIEKYLGHEMAAEMKTKAMNPKRS